MRKTLFIGIVCLLCFGSQCEDPLSEDNIEAAKNSTNPFEDNPSSNCLVGTWMLRHSCGTTATLILHSDGSGSLTDEDCTGQCIRYFPFTWVDHDSYCTITYGNVTICGQPTPAKGGNQNYTCNGNTLVWGDTFTRQ